MHTTDGEAGGQRRLCRPLQCPPKTGRFTGEVARELAGVAGLKRLDLVPHPESAPQALEAFRDHPTLSELGIRLDGAAQAWIDSIAGLRDILRALELPPRRLEPSGSERGTPLDGEILAPLATMLELRELRLVDVIDPASEPVSWVSDLPHLERFRFHRYDIGRFHVRLSQPLAQWYMTEGTIGTLEISRWPESRSVVALDNPRSRARQLGQAVCGIDVRGHVRHYVFRDMPHVTLIGLRGGTTDTITLDGDLSSLEKLSHLCAARRAEVVVMPRAKIGRIAREGR